MDEDVVETSDVEELEDLRSSKRDFNGLHWRDENYSPRKRVKLDTSLQVSRNLDLLSSQGNSPVNLQSFSQTSEMTIPLSRRTTSDISEPLTPSNASEVSNAIYSNTSQEFLDVEMSQDPLLLCSPPGLSSSIFGSSPPSSPLREKNSPIHSVFTTPSTPNLLLPSQQRSTTTPDCSSTIRLYSPMIHLQQSLLSTSAATPASVDVSFMENQFSDDEPLEFPSSPTHNLQPSLPSPSSSQSHFMDDSIQHFTPPSSSKSISENIDSDRAESILEVVDAPPGPMPELSHQLHLVGAEGTGSRYPLRKRLVRQLYPYMAEMQEYKRQMKSAPEAIVKGPSQLHRRRHPEDRYEEEDSQADGYAYDAEDDDNDTRWEERERRRMRREEERQRRSRCQLNGETDHVQLSAVLQDLPSDDEEQEKQRHIFSREAKKLLKERERKRRAQELEGKKKSTVAKSKRFPIPLSSSSITKSVTGDQEILTIYRNGSGSPGNLRESNSMEGNDENHTSERSSMRDCEDDHPDYLLEYFGQDEHYAHAQPENDYDNHDTQPQEQNGVLRNSRLSATEISDNDRQSPPARPSSPLEEDPVTRKRLRYLSRIYPKIMFDTLLNEDKGPPKQKRNLRRPSPTLDSDEDGVESGPLLPGQTRVKRTSKALDLRDIKGDSESSMDEDNDKGDNDSSIRSAHEDGIGRPQSSSDSDEVEYMERKTGQRKRGTKDVIEISDDDSFSSDDGGDIDDAEIHAYLKDDRPHVRDHGDMGRLREGSLIDYMLSRSTVGTSTSRRSSGANGKTRKRHRPTIDVVTHGSRKHGRERQTLLDFRGHDKYSQRSKNVRSAKDSETLPHILRGSNSKNSTDFSFGNLQSHATYNDALLDGDICVHQIPVSEKPQRKGRKQKAKDRRARARRDRLHVFESTSGAHITNGRRTSTKYVTLDIEDYGFHRAIAPLSENRDWSKPFNPSLQKDKLKPASIRHELITGAVAATASDDANEGRNKKPKRSRREIQGDLDIPILHSGMSFDSSTFIGKGWLHELIGVLKSSTAPSEPPTATLCGFELGPSLGLSRLCDSFPSICDGLFDFATSIPDIDAEEKCKEWSKIMRIVCQSTSWFLGSANESEQKRLREVVGNRVTELIARIRALSLGKSALDIMILSLCWFAIEMSARIGCCGLEPAQHNSANILRDSVALMLHHLIDYGLQHTMKPIQRGKELNASSLTVYSAELWVSLVHLLPECGTIPHPPQQFHPFWQAVKESFESKDYSQMSNLEASEGIWRAVFSLCALSQFSVHGMTTGTPRLPACWELIVFALKRIRLVAQPQADLPLLPISLDKRDQYIGLVTTRCCHLVDRWCWKLDDASMLFSQLVEIFRSRRFANLRHEHPEFPLFMLNTNWQALREFNPADTAFVQFLKLIVLAASPEGTTAPVANRVLAPKIKKLLSLAIPVGSLPFTKAHPPNSQEISMLYNRLGAVAIGLYLDPEAHNTRVAHARKYVDFKEADENSRVAVIRGMMNYAILMVKENMPLNSIADWVEEMAMIFAEELKAISDEGAQPVVAALDRLFLNIMLLIGSVSRIVEALKKESIYPEPALLSGLKAILVQRDRLLRVPRVATEILHLFETFLASRLEVIPPPERPRISTTMAEVESQDQYGDVDFGLDFNDPSLLAALDVPMEQDVAGTVEKDAALHKVIHGINLAWMAFVFLKPYLTHPPDPATSEDYKDMCVRWLGCWLGWTSILVTRDNKSAWSTCLSQRDATWGKDENESWRRTIDLNVMLRLLKLDPMAYLTFTDQAFDVFLETLVSPETLVSCEYISLLLSLDGLQHPLLRNLRNVDWLSEDYHISRAEFTAIRIPLLQVIFSNLDDILRQASMGAISASRDKVKYISSLIKLFSAMRGTCASLPAGSDQHKGYVTWCGEFYTVLEQFREIRREPRLEFWLNRERILS